MEYYSLNIELIKQNHKYLYEGLEIVDLESLIDHKWIVESMSTKNGESALVINHEGQEFRLNSLYNPSSEASRWADKFNFKGVQNIISMFGLGNGVFAKAIISKMHKEDILLIYEPSIEIFTYVLNNYDLSELLSNDRVYIIVEKVNEFSFHYTLESKVNLSNLTGQIYCNHPQYDSIFVNSFKKFYDELKYSLSYARSNINTAVSFGEIFILNTIRNLKFLRESYCMTDLYGKIPRDVPAIIISAGPSVEEQIDKIKKIKKKGVIIAVDRVLDYLLSNGVEPDFVVTLDPNKPIEYFTTKTDVSVPLICFLNSSQAILNHHKGKKIICNCDDFISKIYIDANKIPPSTPSNTSVATVAFSICVELGFQKIILIGQDLAYKGEVSHAGGVAEASLGNDVMVEGVDGKEVKSRYDWKQMISYFEDMLVVNPELEVFDVKEYGAKIKGTKNISIEEILNFENIDFNIKETVDSLEKSFNDEEMKNVKKYLTESTYALENINLKCKEAIKECQRVIETCKRNYIDRNVVNKAVKKLGKVNKYIEKQPVYSILETYIVKISAQHMAEMNKRYDNEIEDTFQTFAKSKAIYEAVVEASSFTKNSLEKQLKEI